MKDRRTPRNHGSDGDRADDGKPNMWQRLFGRRTSDTLAPSAQPPAAAAEPADPRRAFIEEVRALRSSGRTDQAIFKLEVALQDQPTDAELHTELHAMYVRAADPYAVLAHGQRWVVALVKAGRLRDGLQALRELHAIDEDFKLTDGDVAVSLAQLAMRDGARELAVGLIDGFDARFPGHAAMPTMYFLGARLLSEHWHKHEQAAQMVRSIIDHFGDHPVAVEAKGYLVALEARIDATKS